MSPIEGGNEMFRPNFYFKIDYFYKDFDERVKIFIQIVFYYY